MQAYKQTEVVWYADVIKPLQKESGPREEAPNFAWSFGEELAFDLKIREEQQDAGERRTKNSILYNDQRKRLVF